MTKLDYFDYIIDTINLRGCHARLFYEICLKYRPDLRDYDNQRWNAGTKLLEEILSHSQDSLSLNWYPFSP